MLLTPLFIILTTLAKPPDEVATARPKQVIRLDAGRAQAPYAIAFSPDGKTLVATGENFSLQVWDLETGKLKYESLNESDDNRDGRAIGVAVDSKRAFVGTSRAVQVWGLEKPKFATTLVAQEERDRKG